MKDLKRLVSVITCIIMLLMCFNFEAFAEIGTPDDYVCSQGNVLYEQDFNYANSAGIPSSMVNEGVFTTQGPESDISIESGAMKIQQSTAKNFHYFTIPENKLTQETDAVAVSFKMYLIDTVRMTLSNTTANS